MIYYEEKRKILIIPTGFGILAESGDCKDAIEEAFNSGWTAGYNSGVTQDCGDAIENAYNSGYTDGLADCSGTSCNLADGELNMGADWSGSEVITPAQGYDGFNSVEVNDTGYGQAKYDEGYSDGIADCSGGTCNLESGNMPLGREWDGDDTIYPSQGYDGFDSVRIYDDGYGDLKYDSGYTQGFNDGQGGTVALQDKSVQQNTNLVTYYPDSGYNGIRSIYVDATGVYSNGHTDGQNYARSLMSSSAFTDNGTYTNPNGWSSVTVNVPQCDCTSAVTEAYDSGYTDGYQSGYTDGFSSGSTYYYNNGYSDGVKQKRVRLSFSFQEMQMTLYGYPRNLIFNGNSQQVYGYGALGADSSSTRTEKIWVDAYTNDASITTLSASCEFHTLTDAFPNSIDLMSVRRGDGVSVSAGTNYITTSFVEQDETGYWYKIEFQVSSSILIKHRYDEGYAEGLAACTSGDCSEAIAEAYNSGQTVGYDSGYSAGYADGLIACSSSGTGPGNVSSLCVIFSGTNQSTSWLPPHLRPFICSGYEFNRSTTVIPPGVEHSVGFDGGTNNGELYWLVGSFPVPYLNVQQNGLSIGVDSNDLAAWGNNWSVYKVIVDGQYLWNALTDNPDELIAGGITLYPKTVTTSPYDEVYTLVNMTF